MVTEKEIDHVGKGEACQLGRKREGRVNSCRFNR